MALNGGRTPPIVVHILNYVVGTLGLLQLGPDNLQCCYLTPSIQLVLITGQPHLLDRHRLSRLVACSPLRAACTNLLLTDRTWSHQVLMSGLTAGGGDLCSLSRYTAHLDCMVLACSLLRSASWTRTAMAAAQTISAFKQNKQDAIRRNNMPCQDGLMVADANVAVSLATMPTICCRQQPRML